MEQERDITNTECHRRGPVDSSSSTRVLSGGCIEVDFTNHRRRSAQDDKHMTQQQEESTDQADDAMARRTITGRNDDATARGNDTGEWLK